MRKAPEQLTSWAERLFHPHHKNVLLPGLGRGLLEISKMASKVNVIADKNQINTISVNNYVTKYVIGPSKPIYDVFKFGAYFKFKMAAKTDNFRISPISANIWAKNICEIPTYMLLNTINTILILLNW